jgi:squalene synthase HpnC
MSGAGALRSGKGHRDENFPVASFLIHPQHRSVILAFYNFVRTADDIADHATLSADQKLKMLDALERSLIGNGTESEGVALREQLAACNLPPQHARDLLTAFRMDVTKLRYNNWDELIGYCTYSAMPVGRFVLDIHGESRATWSANDALCAALQIINHLQDCAKDYRNLDRVYLPIDMLSAAGAEVEDLAAPSASPALRRCLAALAQRTERLLAESRPFAAQIRDRRLSLEVAVIQDVAEHLAGILQRRDPLSEPVHHGKLAFAAIGFGAIAKMLLRRVTRPAPAPEHA